MAALKKNLFPHAKEAIRPAYGFAGRTDVVLYEGLMRINRLPSTPKSQWRGTGRIFYAWEPSPVLRAEITFSGAARRGLHGLGGENLELRFGRRRLERFLVTRIVGDARGNLLVSGVANSSYVASTHSRLATCKFHLINGPEFFGVSLRDGRNQTATWRGRLALESAEWNVTVDTRPGLNSEIPELRAQRACTVSHAGLLTPTASRLCTPSEFDEALTMLYYFFAFCAARRIGPFLPVAFDRQKRKRWEKWGTPVVDVYAGRLSWWDGTSTDQLAQVFPGFARRWKSSPDCMRVVLGCYLEATRDAVSVDARIVFAQPGLERMCYEILVNELGALSHEGIENLAAKDQLRLLLSFMKMSTDVDSWLDALKTEARDLEGGPHALTMVRNSIAHGGRPRKAGKKPRALSRDVKVQAWKIALRYLSSAILYFVGYMGDVQDQTSLEKPKVRVPWA